MTATATAGLLADLSRLAVVPVVALDDAAAAAGLGEALVAGGLPVAEVTFRTDAAAASIRVLAERGDMLVGAGSVRDLAQAIEAVEAGASFVVSPGLSPAVVKFCQAAGVPVLPGAVTATEVMAALDLGLTTVKFFPAEASGGTAAIKALSAPLGGVSFVPTGGVGPANLKDYLSLSCVLAVGGTWMVPSDALATGDFSRIERLTREAVTLIGSIR